MKMNSVVSTHGSGGWFNDMIYLNDTACNKQPGDRRQ